MSKVRADKKTNRLSIALFKYVDRTGWEQETRALDYDSVFKKLKKLRKTGRQQAIIVDSGFKLRP